MTTTAAHEPVICLPTGRLVATVVAAAAVTAAAWMTGAALTGHGAQWGAGAAGAGLVAAITIAGVMAMRPWKPRPVSTWTSLWLAALVGRLLVTPVLAFLLYSATPFSLVGLMLSVAVTYVVVQISEAAAVAAYLKRIV